MPSKYLRCNKCSHVFKSKATKPQCGQCKGRQFEEIDKATFEEEKAVEKQLDAEAEIALDDPAFSLATPSGALDFASDPGGAPALRPAPLPLPSPAPSPPSPPVDPNGKSLNQFTAAIDKFTRGMALQDQRMTRIESRLGLGEEEEKPAPDNGGITDGMSMKEYMGQMMQMSFVKMMQQNLAPPPPTNPQGGAEIVALRQEIRDLAAKIDTGKSIEPQLINSLQQQVESMRQETARREDNKILQAIMQTRQTGPSELQTFMAGMNMGADQQRQAVSAGQDAYAQSQAAFANAAADVLKGDGTSPIRGAAKDVLDLAVQGKRQELMVQQGRIEQGLDPHQVPTEEVPLEQVEREMQGMGIDTEIGPEDDPGLRLL